MLFLAELDRVTPDAPMTPEAGRAFIEQVIFPTIARAEELLAGGVIVAGGPVAGRVALKFVLQAENAEHADRLITSLPLWLVAETRVTPLITFAERREHVQELLTNLRGG